MDNILDFTKLDQNSARFHEHPHVIHRKWLTTRGDFNKIDRFKDLLPLDNLSFYIHVPFCDSGCKFCKFFHILPEKEILNKYSRTAIKQIEFILKNIPVKKNCIKSVYFGGGSPPIVGTAFINEACELITKYYGDLRGVEITSEMRPRDLIKLHERKITLSPFINRVSIGIQTFSSLRKKFNRIYDQQQIQDTIKWFDDTHNIILCADLMYGLPGQSVNDHIEDLKEIDTLPISGLSIYRLNAHGNCLPSFNLREEKESYNEQTNILKEWVKLTPANYLRPPEKSTYIKYSNRTNGNVVAIGPSALGKIGPFSYYFPPSITDYCSTSEIQYCFFSRSFNEDRSINDLFVFGELDKVFESKHMYPLLKQIEKGGMVSEVGKGRWSLTKDGVFWSRAIASLISEYQEKQLA